MQLTKRKTSPAALTWAENDDELYLGFWIWDLGATGIPATPSVLWWYTVRTKTDTVGQGA